MATWEREKGSQATFSIQTGQNRHLFGIARDRDSRDRVYIHRSILVVVCFFSPSNTKRFFSQINLSVKFAKRFVTLRYFVVSLLLVT